MRTFPAFRPLQAKRAAAGGKKRPKELSAEDAWNLMAGNQTAELHDPGQEQLCLAGQIDETDENNLTLKPKWVGLDCTSLEYFVCKYF